METFGVATPSGSPCQRTRPAEGIDNPVSMRRSVDFPDPDGPSNATISPELTARSVGAITRMGSPCGCAYDFCTSCASMMTESTAMLFVRETQNDSTVRARRNRQDFALAF